MGKIPQLNQLAQYDVNRANQTEGIKWSFYDTLTYAAAGQQQLTFFQTQKGQNGKTYAQTNMTAAGALPKPQNFLVTGIELYFFPGGNPATAGVAPAAALNFVNDVWKFSSSLAWLEFFVGSKAYLEESPLMKFPPACGLSVAAAISDSTTAGAAQRASVEYASMGGRPYELDPAILLIDSQNFNINLNWNAPVTISADATVKCVMNGFLYRLSQ